MGIDYGLGRTNVSATLVDGERIRYGVIPQHEVLQAWCDGCETYWGKPTCPECGAEFEEHELEDCHNHCDCGNTFDSDSAYGDEPLSYYVDDGEYQAESDSYGDIFITKSPYYTPCGFCSPCAPGAGYLTDRRNDCIAFCFGPDWFDDPCPYPVYRVSDGKCIYLPGTKNDSV